MTKASIGLDFTIFPLPKFEPTEIILVSPCAVDPSAETSLNLPPLITIPHVRPPRRHQRLPKLIRLLAIGRTTLGLQHRVQRPVLCLVSPRRWASDPPLAEPRTSNQRPRRLPSRARQLPRLARLRPRERHVPPPWARQAGRRGDPRHAPLPQHDLARGAYGREPALVVVHLDPKPGGKVCSEPKKSAGDRKSVV